MEVDLKVEDSKLIVRPIPSVNDLLQNSTPAVEMSLKEFQIFRRELGRKAESS